MDPAGNHDASLSPKTFRDTDGTRKCIDRNGYADDIRGIRIVDAADILVLQFHIMVFANQIYDRQKTKWRCHMQL